LQTYSLALAGTRSVLLTAVAALPAALLTALSAQIAVPLPWTPVPVTLQVFAVLAAAGLLGPRMSAVAQAEYLLMGLAGAPVFAGLRAGPAAILSPTGGYILAFLPASVICGALAQRRTLSAVLLGCACAAGVIHAGGLLWMHLTMGVPLDRAFALASAPFIAVDAAKVAAAAAVILTAKRAASPW